MCWATVELAKEKVNLADRRLRLRKLVIQPGGVVPWHSHEDRPAIIYVVSGTINEYASNCSVPIEHKTGEVSVEKNGRAALVEEHRQEPGRAAVGGPVPRREARGRPHDVSRRRAHELGARPLPRAPSFPERIGPRPWTQSTHAMPMQPMHMHEHRSGAAFTHAAHRPHRVPDGRSTCSAPRRSCRRLTKAYGVTPAAMGFAVNATTMGMAVAGLGVAYFSRSIDRRRGILVALTVLALPTALLAVAPNLAVFTALRVAQGLCMAAAFTLTLAYLGEHCSMSDAAGAFAAYITGNVASNLFGRLLAAGLADHLGLQTTFLALAALNLAGAGLVWFGLTHATP